MKTMSGCAEAADAVRDRKGEAAATRALLAARTLRRLMRLPSESPPGGLACIFYPCLTGHALSPRIALDLTGTDSTLARRHPRPARMQARARPAPRRRHRRRPPPRRRRP